MSLTHVFEEIGSDEEDSIPTDSTASDVEEEYPVERILSEKRDHRGRVFQYLVKWEGYPLAQATWEPPSNIEAEEILEGWRAHQQAVKNGDAELFDVTLWDEAYIKAAEETENRRRRRKAKRRRRGIPVSPSPEPASAVRESNAQSTHPSRNPTPEPIPVRTITARSRLTLGDSDGDDPSIGRRTSDDIAKPAVARKKYVAQQVSQKKTSFTGKRVRSASPESRTEPSKRRRSASPKIQKGATIKDKSSSPDEPPVHRASNAQPRALSPDPKRRTSDLTILSTKPVTAKRNLLPIIPAKKPINIFATTKKPVKPGRRGGKAATGTDRHFHKLSLANHYHKAARNDDQRAPDFDKLTMIDPATGKTQPVIPQAGPPPPSLQTGETMLPEPGETPQSAKAPLLQQKPSTTGGSFTPQQPSSASSNPLASVYGRRSPRAARRERTPSPPAVIGKHNVCASFAGSGFCSRGANCPNPHIPDVRNKSNWACFYWTKGFCRKSAAECDFAHSDAPYKSGHPGSFDRAQVVDEQVGLFLERLRSQQEQSVEDTSKTRIPTPPQREPSLTLTTISQLDALTETAPKAKPSAPTPTLRASTQSPKLPHGAADFATASGPPNGNRPDSPLTAVNSPPVHDAAPKSALNVSTPANDVSAVVLRVQAGPQTFDLAVRLDTPNLAGLRDLLRPTDGGVHLNISLDRMVAAADLLKAHPSFPARVSTYPAGNIIPERETSDKIRQLSCLADHRVAAFVGFSQQYTILCYRYGEDWRALDDPSVPRSDAAPLRFRFGPPLDKLPLAAGPSLHSLLDLDETRLFPKKEDGKIVTRSALIMLPPDRQQESTVLAKYLQGMECEVFHIDVPGAWNHFQSLTDACRILLVDPAMELHRIPGLPLYLRHGTVFSWGVNERLHLLEGQTPTFSCERLFPRGEVVFITDETFLYHPAEVAKMIRSLIEVKAGGARKDDKIAARPGIKDWLLRLILDHHRSDMEDVYGQICRLCPYDAEDLDFPGNPSEKADLISARLDEFEGSAWWQVKDFAGHDPRATELMIQWFAGWSSLMAAHKYRHFTVAHLTKEPTSVFNSKTNRSEKHFTVDPQKWADKWHHLTVSLPEGIMNKWKPSKKS